jgi:hypothetical protein
MKLIDNFIILGFDDGNINVYDRETLELLSQQQVTRHHVKRILASQIPSIKVFPGHDSHTHAV